MNLLRCKFYININTFTTSPTADGLHQGGRKYLRKRKRITSKWKGAIYQGLNITRFNLVLVKKKVALEINFHLLKETGFLLKMKSFLTFQIFHAAQAHISIKHGLPNAALVDV
jgi:hypothetical protein